MSSERLPPDQIEAMKARIEEQLEGVEGAALALEKWMTEWRIRMADPHGGGQGQASRAMISAATIGWAIASVAALWAVWRLSWWLDEGDGL